MATQIAQAPAAPANVFGGITPPPGVREYGELGIIDFFSNVLKIVAVGAGLFVFLNVIYAGYLYLSGGGDSNTHTKVRDQLTYSVLGLVLIVASYAIAILVGVIFFGKADYIINPTICGPGSAGTPGC